jgi:glucose/mannose-6-phosphate isomerase
MLLDDEKTIARIDSGNVRASIEALPDQIEVAWRDAQKVNVPASYQEADQIVVAGMGGSSLPAHLIQSVYGGALRVPFSFVNSYALPGSVGKKSVVIISSYSGTTEETIACYKDALKRKAKILGLTSGGTLSKLFKKDKIPAYIFDPVHNACGQPRMGLGYMVAGLLGLINSFQDFALDLDEVAALPDRLRRLAAAWLTTVPMRDNSAKLMAHALAGTIPVIVAAEHLIGNGHVLQNQIHESPKQFCAAFPLSEMNHHLMEGLKFPDLLHSTLGFLFIGSDLYSERLNKRIRATEKVLGKQGYGFNLWEATAPTRLGQAFEALAFGSWLSFYMAMQNRANPSDIPWVNFFKKELGRG